MKEIERRLERLEVERHGAIVLLWAGEQPEAEVIFERFGEAGPPAGAEVVCLRWADEGEAQAPAGVTFADDLVRGAWRGRSQ